MAKVASVRLSWTRSPSSDVTMQKINVTINGDVKTIEIGPEVESYQLDINASSAVSFDVVSIDDDANVVSSEVYNFRISDLEAPLPATILFHEIVSIRDE